MFEIKRKADERETAGGMDRISKTVFKPIYPVIAENAVNETGIREGVCIDAGSGPASLAIAMAEYPFMVYALDHSPVSNEIAERNIEEAGLSGRITVIEGDIEAIPLESGISREGIFRDRTGAEIRGKDIHRRRIRECGSKGQYSQRDDQEKSEMGGEV